MSAIDILLRGAVTVTTRAELQERLGTGKKLRVKLGVDPTMSDLHLGHTVCLRKMRQFQDAGNVGVLIIGDFTARIGDPSGRSDIRPVLTAEQIAKNMESFKEQAFKILDEAKTEVRFNSEWLDRFVAKGELLSALQRITHAQLTEREDFKKRIMENQPISMLEILYPVFQGHDSVAVASDVELGGTDQTFNLLFGRRLQQDAGQKPQVTLTMPLLVGTDGVRKMSKTYGNAVALNDTPKDMFGKVMSVSDEAMLVWAELLTALDLAALKGGHPMEIKKRIASEIVCQYHGDAAARAACEEFVRVHSGGEVPENMPEVRLPKDSKPMFSQLLVSAGLAPSRKEAQRKISEGAVRLDGVALKQDVIVDIKAPAVLSLGRRGFCRIIP
ncbi:MAG: tyrosine--tRNA ligase [Elusimicrobiota bacterium]